MPQDVQFFDIPRDTNPSRIYSMKIWQILALKHVMMGARSHMNVGEGMDFWAKVGTNSNVLISDVKVEKSSVLRTPPWATHVVYVTPEILRLIPQLSTNRGN